MRIVSLLASATEMIAELGCLDQLVGRSHECDYPPEIQPLPVVSTVQIDTHTPSNQIDAQVRKFAHTLHAPQDIGLKALSIYRIDTALLQQLQPDIIFTQTQCEVCAVSEQDVIQALHRLTGLRARVVSLAPFRLEDIWEDFLRVGRELGKIEQAQRLVQSHKQELETLQQVTTTLSQQGHKPRVAVLEWLDPLMAAGNWIPALVAYAGGELVLGNYDMHADTLSWEDLQTANPEVLILAPCGFTIERTIQELPLLQAQPAWQSLQAVQHGRVYAIDGNAYLNRSGPRVVESTKLLGKVLWGTQLDIEVDERGWIPIK